MGRWCANTTCMTYKKGYSVQVEGKHQTAFYVLKDKLTSAPVLVHFRPGDPIEVRVDSCDYGIGGMLLQEREGAWHLVAFVSRSLHHAEINYTISVKEALAAAYALTTFRPLISDKS